MVVVNRHSVKVTRTRPVPVSVVAASEDLNHIAVGLYDGSVLVYTGTLTRVRIGSSKTPRVVHEGTFLVHEKDSSCY